MRVEFASKVDHDDMLKNAISIFRVRKSSAQIVKTKDEARNFGLKLMESDNENGIIVISVDGNILMKPEALKMWYNLGGNRILVTGARKNAYLSLYY